MSRRGSHRACALYLCIFGLVPDLATETRVPGGSRQAHRREAHAAIADVEKANATNRHTGPDPAGLLQTMKGNLKAVEVHRALIVRNIEDIKSRRYRRLSLRPFLRVLRHLRAHLAHAARPSSGCTRNALQRRRNTSLGRLDTW